MIELKLLKTYYPIEGKKSTLASFVLETDKEKEEVVIQVYFDGRKVSEGEFTLKMRNFNRFAVVGIAPSGYHNVKVVVRKYDKKKENYEDMEVLGEWNFKVYVAPPRESILRASTLITTGILMNMMGVKK